METWKTVLKPGPVICPLLTKDIDNPVYCQKNKCGFWNISGEGDCGIANIGNRISVIED